MLINSWFALLGDNDILVEVDFESNETALLFIIGCCSINK